MCSLRGNIPERRKKKRAAPGGGSEPRVHICGEGFSRCVAELCDSAVKEIG